MTVSGEKPLVRDRCGSEPVSVSLSVSVSISISVLVSVSVLVSISISVSVSATGNRFWLIVLMQNKPEPLGLGFVLLGGFVLTDIISLE